MIGHPPLGLPKAAVAAEAIATSRAVVTYLTTHYRTISSCSNRNTFILLPERRVRAESGRVSRMVLARSLLINHRELIKKRCVAQTPETQILTIEEATARKRSFC